MSATLEVPFAARTLADIAVAVPGATEVFRRHRLDFCCGGKVSLAEAARKKDLDIGALEAELDAVRGRAAPAARPEATADLIDLIETRYHAVHRQELPELLRLARKVEAVHKGHPNAPHGLAALLDRIGQELTDHMAKEEQILFPLMRRGGHPMITQPIAVMLAEHDDHGEHLRRLGALTNDFTPPPEACPTWRALYAGCRKLADDLMEHIHLENNILFPRFA